MIALIALGLMGAIETGPVDEGRFAFVKRGEQSWEFADVIVEGDAMTVRFLHAKSRKRLGGHKDGLYLGERGDDGLFVFHRGTDEPVTLWVDKRGRTVLTVPRECTSFFEGRSACAWRGDGRTTYGFIDKKGDTVIGPTFASVGRFRDGVTLVQSDAATEEERVYAFIDVTGAQRFRRYSAASAFSQGRAFVVAGDDPAHRGYIDGKGALVIALDGESGDPFSSGVAVVRGPSGERVIDESGKLVMRIPLPFRVLDAFVDGRARLGVHGSVGAVLALDGTISEVSELWQAPPPWPIALGPAPSAAMQPKGKDYGFLRTVAAKASDCAGAAAEMVALSRGGDPDAWAATEECARRANELERAREAHAAWVYVTSLDPSYRQAREAWAALGGRIPLPAEPASR